MLFRQPAPGFKRALITGVLLAFVLAQALGLMHRIVHVSMPAAGADVVQASVEARQADVAWLKALFVGHHHERGCDLFDQSSHADLVCGQPLDLALQGPGAVTEQLHPGWHLAAQAAGFLARGPPSLA